MSLIENGKRSPSSACSALAAGARTSLDELLGAEPPSRRAALEIELERYQRSPLYESLNLPKIRIGPRLPIDVLESMVGLHHELERWTQRAGATPEEARRANAELRAMMREQDNYFGDIEAEAQRSWPRWVHGRSAVHHVLRTSPGTSVSACTTWRICRIRPGR